MDNEQPTPIEYLTTINNKRLFIKRDDLNHPLIQGNKLRKLKYTLKLATEKRHTLISFGGAYSNHIAALAAAGKIFHLKTVGIIRGEELSNTARWGKTLKNAHKNGMILHFVNRQEYRKKDTCPTIQALIKNYTNALILPEGGSNALALKGSAEVIKEITIQQSQPFHRLLTACGTGGTLAGFIDGAEQYGFSGELHGIAVLKGATFLLGDIKKLSHNHQGINWTIHHNYHFGGYAKSSPNLLTFIKQFQSTYQIPIEPIYTGKLCYAAFDLAARSTDTPENWLIYHSGGLQGLAS